MFKKLFSTAFYYGLDCCSEFTKIEQLQQVKKSILHAEIFIRALCTMIFDERKTSSSQYVIVSTIHQPVEV